MLVDGEQISIWALGEFVSLAESVSEQIEKSYGLKISVVNARFVKPLDKSLIIKHAQKHHKIITLEDNVVAGGFGSAVLEVINQEGLPTQVIRLGWPDEYIPHGSTSSSLRKSYLLDKSSIYDEVVSHLDIESLNKNLAPLDIA